MTAAASGSFDFVVVGSGSGGSVVARRLVDAGASVALIEAGGQPSDPAIHDPGRWPELPGSPADWGYATEPQAACAGRQLSWPRGKVLGGTSALNGLAHIRGHRLDYDGWAYHGAPGWGFDDVLPLFKRSEDSDLGPSEYRGAGGPLPVTAQYPRHPLIEAMVAAAQEAGIPYNPDHNGPELDGVGYSQLTMRDGVRATAWSAFLEPVVGQPNLTVLTGARALRLRFDRGRCVGAEIERDGKTELVEAGGEVIVCAGAIDSPRLLLLSGIGPAAELAALGIERRVDLPGVGKNLHDHLLSPVIFSSPKPVPERVAGVTQLHAHLFWRSRPGLVVPDTQPLCFHLPLYRAGDMSGPEDAYTLMGGLVRVESRGELRLVSADPDVPPSLDPRCLTAAADVDALTASVALMREIGRQPALAEWTAEELYPGPSVRTAAELREYVRSTVASYHHQVGTCRMGGDEQAVVDPELRVYGVDGLRVADASVMPFITTGNTNAPTLMIGEKASELLLAAAR
ncbi:MAG TPA: GMC family oxidoreductase N-terminal domain-containing protein [Gaiellaceae bacterium]